MAILKSRPYSIASGRGIIAYDHSDAGDLNQMNCILDAQQFILKKKGGFKGSLQYYLTLKN